jgi:steroid delta-isomerase-like uncharacterized protein
MAEQDSINIARGVVEAFNNDDWERMAGLLTPDSLYRELGTQREMRGSAEIMQALQGWKQAMPDVKASVTNALASGNTALLEVVWEGTHTGPLQSPGGTIPASGKLQRTPSAFIFEITGDKVKESRNYFDMVTFLQQIGLQYATIGLEP